MIKIIKQSFSIDLAISINSFIYLLKKTPIIKSFLPNNLYQNKKLKAFAFLLSILFGIGKSFMVKGIYLMIVYQLAIYLNDDPLSFVTMFISLTVLGAFINHKITTSSKKKYYSVILMNMDAKRYTVAYFLTNQVTALITHLLILPFVCFLIEIPLIYGVLLSVFLVLIKPVGEAYNLWYFKKHKYLAMNNYRHYFTLVIIFLGAGVALLYFNYLITLNMVYILILIAFILSIISIKYIISIKDYSLIYKKLNIRAASVNDQDQKMHARQLMVQVKDKDKKINPKKLKNKKGYQLFNVIFFERHKYLLLSSALKFSAAITAIFLFLIVFIMIDNTVSDEISSYLLNSFSFIILIMYFINRGAVVTQAMFFNCDSAMLRFNFYRERHVIIQLFKERLKMLVKINLIPSSVISIGLILLFFITGTSRSIIDYLFIVLSVNSISIFFSVHYLVLYYLLQPYTQDLRMKSFSYGIITTLTYFIAFSSRNLDISLFLFTILMLVFTGLYILISISLVYKKAQFTFKIR